MERQKQDLTYIFVGDIGGTNANFGVISRENGNYKLMASYQSPSQKISDFTQVVFELLEKIAAEHHIRCSAMIIGVAGALCGDQHQVHLTNLPFTIDSAALKTKTGITEVLMINDFTEVVYGYPFVENSIAINSAAVKQQGQLAFIGAGTGLGQAAAVWSWASGHYIPLASEGGHTEFVIYNEFDQELARFIQERTLSQAPVTWEEVLSGRGISTIYELLGIQGHYQATDITEEIAQSRFQPDYISRYAEHDERCKKTFRLYSFYYARFAKQVALQTVPCGGLYIAGGIAAKNKQLFLTPEWLKEFTFHEQHHILLQKIPVFLIQDYQVSLYGGAHYYTLYEQKIV